MTVEEFKKRAQEIYDENEGYAGEDGHIQVDRLIDALLRACMRARLPIVGSLHWEKTALFGQTATNLVV